MKAVFKSIAFIVTGYSIASLINMGLVLLFYYDGVLAPTFVLFPIEILVIILSSFGIGFYIYHWFKLTSRWPIYTLMFLLIAITGLNIYLDQSLEPLWYKITYIITVAPSLLFGMTQNEKTET